LLLPVGGSWQQGCPRDYLRAKALGVPLGEASVPKTQSSKAALGITFAPAALGVPLGEASVPKTQSSKAALGITFAPAALGVPLGEASVHQGITFALKRSVFPWGRLQFQKRKAARLPSGLPSRLRRSVFPWGRLQLQKRKAARHSFLWQQAAKNKLACFSDLLS